MKFKNNLIYTINIGKKRKIIAFFAYVFIIFAIICLYIHFLVTPLIVNTASAKMKVLANRSIDYAVTEAMTSYVTYDDLIKISKDENGNIKTMQANSSKVNNVSRMITQIALAKLVDLGNEPIKIPIGAFTGITAFSGLGPNVDFKITPYGDISCSFMSVFSDAGINQTQHRIYVNIDAVIRVVFPTGSVVVNSVSDVLICESVLIGEIPDTYLKSNSLTEMLNLVP